MGNSLNVSAIQWGVIFFLFSLAFSVPATAEPGQDVGAQFILTGVLVGVFNQIQDQFWVEDRGDPDTVIYEVQNGGRQEINWNNPEFLRFFQKIHSSLKELKAAEDNMTALSEIDRAGKEPDENQLKALDQKFEEIPALDLKKLEARILRFRSGIHGLRAKHTNPFWFNDRLELSKTAYDFMKQATQKDPSNESGWTARGKILSGMYESKSVLIPQSVLISKIEKSFNFQFINEFKEVINGIDDLSQYTYKKIDKATAAIRDTLIKYRTEAMKPPK